MAKEWDKKSKKNVFWEDTMVFKSIDPETGKNREASIRVEEGLHDGYLEILLKTPANFLNLKIRPAMGFIEAYHDNSSATFGITNMNYRAEAYMGFTEWVKEAVEKAELEINLNIPTAEQLISMLKELGEAEDELDKHLDDLNEFTGSFLKENYKDVPDRLMSAEDFLSFIEDVRGDFPTDRESDLSSPTNPKLPVELLNPGSSIINVKTSDIFDILNIVVNEDGFFVIESVLKKDGLHTADHILTEDDYLEGFLKIVV